MDTNEYSEMQELVGIRVPGEAGFGQFVVFVAPRISPNETRMNTNKCCENNGFRENSCHRRSLFREIRGFCFSTN